MCRVVPWPGGLRTEIVTSAVRPLPSGFATAAYGSPLPSQRVSYPEFAGSQEGCSDRVTCQHRLPPDRSMSGLFAGNCAVLDQGEKVTVAVVNGIRKLIQFRHLKTDPSPAGFSPRLAGGGRGR